MRCAIYTRKSTEEGLEQEFNTLDAQRESGEAFDQRQSSLSILCLQERTEDWMVELPDKIYPCTPD